MTKWAAPSSNARRVTPFPSASSDRAAQDQPINRHPESLRLRVVEEGLRRGIPGRDPLLEVGRNDRRRAQPHQRLKMLSLALKISFTNAKGLLQLLLLGDIEQKPVMESRHPSLGRHNRSLIQEPSNPSIPRHHPILGAQSLPGLVRTCMFSKHSIAVVGMKHAHEEIGIGRPLLHRVAKRNLEMVTGVDV